MEKNSGPSRTVRLSISGRQTDPEGHTQENTALYRADCRADGEGWLFTYMENGMQARLYLSRSLAWMERGGPGRGSGGTRLAFDPAVRETAFMYETPFGRIPMRIRTEGIALLGGRERVAVGSAPTAAPSEQPASPRQERPFRLSARIRYVLQMDDGYGLACVVTVRASDGDF